MMLAVLVTALPTGSFCTDTCVSVFCVTPPKGISTVEAPIVESNISISPRCDTTLSSCKSFSTRSRNVAPATSRRNGSRSSTAATRTVV